MRASQARALAGADLVIWIGPELTPWLERVLAALPGERKDMILNRVPETTLLSYSGHDDHHSDAVVQTKARHNANEDDHDDDHGHDHNDDNGDNPATEPHSSHATDNRLTEPHSWLDPWNAGVWTAAIAARLSVLDPENAQIYAANAKAAIRVIDDVTLATHSQISSRAIGSYIVLHDAYRYFERRFDLEHAAAISMSDATAPGARHLKKVRDSVTETGASCVLIEPQLAHRLIDAIDPENRLTRVVIDPLGATISPGISFYPDLIRNIGASFSACSSAAK